MCVKWNINVGLIIPKNNIRIRKHIFVDLFFYNFKLTNERIPQIYW